VADDDKIEFIEIEGANGYVTEVFGSVALVADQDD